MVSLFPRVGDWEGDLEGWNAIVYPQRHFLNHYNNGLQLLNKLQLHFQIPLIKKKQCALIKKKSHTQLKS